MSWKITGYANLVLSAFNFGLFLVADALFCLIIALFCSIVSFYSFSEILKLERTKTH